MDRISSWQVLDYRTQILNVYSEVNRAITWKNRNNNKRKDYFALKAIELLSLTKVDNKNYAHLDELNNLLLELIDYIFGDNKLNNTDENIIKFYINFI